MSSLPPDSAPSTAAPAAGADHDALPPGTRFGEFEIQRVLGVGGFGIVYLAHDHSLEREVALKEYMPASLAARGQGPQITVRSSSFAETYAIGLRSFVNEARLLARFDHPSLVKVYRFWEDNATAYMVMPFLQGVTLRDTRRRMAHPPDEAWIRSVITPILSALELLHREGVYHRDIAPDNILLPPDGPPVLLDFGAARRVISDRTQSLTAILKPSYAPIEQYAEMTQLRQGPWTDLYALGAVIHYLLFGAPPAPATARAVQDDVEAIEHRIVPGVSPRFIEAMSWMLAIRPNQRPQSGEQLRAVLDGNAAIPPRGRSGITLPPNVAAPQSAAAFEPLPGGIESADDATRVNAAHLPTHLRTAQAPPPGPAVATGFSPTAAMPTARLPPTQVQASAGAPPTALPQTVGPASWPPSPAATLPPQAASAQSAAAAAAMPARSSKAGLVVAGVAALVAVAAVGAWQFSGKKDAPAADTAAAPPVVAPVVIAPPSAVVAAPAVVAAQPAATVETPAASAAPVPVTVGATAAPETKIVPVSPPTRPPAAAARVAVPGDAPAKAGGSAGSPVPEKSATAGLPAVAAVPAATTKPRVGGTPVPRPGGEYTTSGSSGAPARPDTTTYGSPPSTSSGNTYANPGERPRPSAAPPQREPALAGRPVPAQPTTAAEPPQPASAREACGKRVFISLAICMDERCEEARFRNTAECIPILERKRARENR